MTKLKIIFGDEKKVGEILAQRTLEDIAKNTSGPYAMACAKGSSALAFYESLKEDYKSGEAIAFSLDEDFGTTNSYDFLKKNLPEAIKIEEIMAKFNIENKAVDSTLLSAILETNSTNYIKRGREIMPLHLQNELFTNILDSCSEYERKIGMNHGIDLAIIGLGEPLHIGSNFPPTHRDSRTHLAEKIDKDGNIIGYAITLGISNLCSAKKAYLFAFGEKKAAGVKKFLECTPDMDNAAAYIRETGNLTLALDGGAAKLLNSFDLEKRYDLEIEKI